MEMVKRVEVQASYFKIDGNRKIELKQVMSINTQQEVTIRLLITCVGNNFRTGTCRLSRQDLNAVVDLGSIKSISTLGIGFLQDVGNPGFIFQNRFG